MGVSDGGSLELRELQLDLVANARLPATVWICGGAKSELPKSPGSGTLFRTASGGVVVLTAEHLRDRGEPTRLGYMKCQKAIFGAFTRATRFPESSIDVAVFEIKAEHWELLRPWALPIDAIDPTPRLRSGTRVYVTGHPSDRLRVSQQSVGYVTVAVEAMTTNDGDTPADLRGGNRVHRVEWVEGVTQRHRVAWITESGRRLRKPPSSHEPLPGGFGVSGGALWTVPTDGLWDASRSRCVGVASRWVDSVQYFEPASIWFNWFRAELAR